jgi:hypothetical protein
LESFISLEFDATALHVTVLYTRRVRHGSTYLNGKEFEAQAIHGAVRAPNGETVDYSLPLYLNDDHANSVLAELVDNSMTRLRDDLVHAIVVESMRRQARWVGKFLIEEYSLTPQLERSGYHLVPHKYKPGRIFKCWQYRRETETEMLVRFAKAMPKQGLLDCWWNQAQVGGRVILYCHAFYKTLAKGKSLKDFKTKYDPVLGAVYPEDIIAIKQEKSLIESVDLKGSLVRMGYSGLGDEEVHQLCVWAMEAREGYSKTDPLAGGWKSTTSSVTSTPKRGSPSRIGNYANTDGLKGCGTTRQGNGKARVSNRFAVLDNE